MTDDPITQMAQDPAFAKLNPAQQREALTAHDNAFGNLSDDQIARFVTTHQASAPSFADNPEGYAAAQAHQAGAREIKTAAAMPEGQVRNREDLGLPPTASTEEVKNAYERSSGAFAGAASGTMLGATAPTMLTRALATGAASGAGSAAGGATPKEAGVIGITGAVLQPAAELGTSALSWLGKKLLAPAAEKTASWWSDITGYTKALEEAKNANAAKYMLSEQKGGQAVAEGQANVAAVKAAQPQGQIGNWSDLNQSIGAPASKSIRIGKGSADIENAFGLPGRGLEAEGFTKEALQKMTPVDQAAVIGPRFQAAGKAVQATADKATEQGITLDAGKSVFSVIKDRIKDPTLQEKAIEIINSHQQELGIANIRQATPTQALALRQALKNDANFGPNATVDSLKGVGRAIYGGVSNDLHNAVPGMKAVDMHYGDLAQAVDVVRQNTGKYMAGKWTAPQTAVQKAEAAVPEMPSVSPYTPLPSSGSYNLNALKKILAGLGFGAGAGAGGYEAWKRIAPQAP